jgi:hypothetical protein
MLIGAVAVGVFAIPTTIEELKIAHQLAAPSPGNANFIRPGEDAALNYLARNKEPGGVLTGSYLGAVVPGRTGRHTYVGDCLWSEPGCLSVTRNAQALFSGAPSRSVARRFVVSSGARFVLTDCETAADMRTLLGPVIRSTHLFGCAAVYEVE